MPKLQKKVRNWKDYNKSLKKRGTIIFSFDKKHLSELYYLGKQKRGGKRKYNKAMYEYLLTVKVLLRLPWRAASGLVEELLKTPDVTQSVSRLPLDLSRRKEVPPISTSFSSLSMHTAVCLSLTFLILT